MKKYITALFLAMFMSACNWNVIESPEVLYVSSKVDPPFIWRSNVDLKMTNGSVKAIVDPIMKPYAKSPLFQVLEEISEKVNINLLSLGFKESAFEFEFEGGDYVEDFRSVSSKDDRPVMAGDLPLVYFGDPTNSVSDYEGLPFDETRENVLVVTSASKKWRSLYAQSNSNQPSLFVYVGLIQVTPTRVNGTYSVQIAKDNLIPLDRRGSIDMPINVIALKGVQLDEKGNVVASVVHGVVPMWPKDAYVNADFSLERFLFGIDSQHEHHLTDYIGTLDQYDWGAATKTLLDSL